MIKKKTSTAKTAAKSKAAAARSSAAMATSPNDGDEVNEANDEDSKRDPAVYNEREDTVASPGESAATAARGEPVGTSKSNANTNQDFPSPKFKPKNAKA